MGIFSSSSCETRGVPEDFSRTLEVSASGPDVKECTDELKMPIVPLY